MLIRKHRQYVDCSLRQGGVIREDGGNESGPDAFDNSDEELEDDDTGIVPLLESELYPNSKIFRRQNCLGKRKREESVREWLGYTVENDPAPEYSAMLQIGTELLQACPELYIDKIRKLRRVLDGSATPADRVIKDCPEPQLLGLYDISNTLHELIHRTWSRRSHHLLSPMSSTVLIKREPDDQGTNPSSSVVNKGPTIPGDLCTLTKKELGASLQGMLTHLHFLKYSGSLTEDNPKATSADMLDWRDVLVAGKAYGIPDPVLKRCYLRMARLTPDNAFTIKEFILIIIILSVTASVFLRDIRHNGQIMLYKENGRDQVFAQFFVSDMDLVARTATFRVSFQPMGTYNQKQEDEKGQLKVSVQEEVYDISQTAWHKDHMVTIPFQFGNVGYYPSDRYLATISISTVWEVNGTSTNVPMSLGFRGNIPSIHLQPVARRFEWDEHNEYGIRVQVKRTGFTKFFVGFVLFCVWLTSLGLPAALITAGIRKDRTALAYTLIYGLGFLCACPILRTFFPGAPPLGSLADILGLMWPMIINVFTLTLGIHMWWIRNWASKGALLTALHDSPEFGKKTYPAVPLEGTKHPLLSETVLPQPVHAVRNSFSSQSTLSTLAKDTLRLPTYPE
ncbi:F-box only protein 9 [Dispira parvispora]|uniref:F-box only protein 9 n=1 Tax=Dispira parvispora TaxID=1520584 RepID=A0A9W8E632_9FUNG|nr:F-box only protein 9 [Dispira parvispora]